MGYHSTNCSELCSFPSFGYDCQGTCQCNLSLCDHRFGCSENIGMLSGTFYLHFCFKKVNYNVLALNFNFKDEKL